MMRAMSSRTVARVVVVALTLAAGCRPPPPTKPLVVEADPWETVVVPGASAPLYLYPAVIARYAPRDRGAYVVRVRGTDVEARRALARLLIRRLPGREPDDVVDDDGFVVRLTAEEHDVLAQRPEVRRIDILQPTERVGRAYDRERPAPEVRIDLFADATDGERDALARWLAMRGGEVIWSGGRGLRARLASPLITEAARIGIVRWIE
jgi:hypothetical protein